jgi:hypothetical protein
MSTLTYLRAGPAHERRLFVKALLILVLTRLAVSTLSLGQLRSFLTWVSERSAAPQAHDDYAQRVTTAVTRASALVPGSNSLTRALATITLMRCRGLVGSLRLAAHPGGLAARLTYKGQVLVGDPAAEGHPLPGDQVWQLGPPAALQAFDDDR